MINSINANTVGYTTYGTTGSSDSTREIASYTNVPERLSQMPGLEQYESLIDRFLSGESKMENPNEALTKDQIALRSFMRAYQKTDPRSLFQTQQDMQKGNESFEEYWKKHGNGAPAPARLIKPDGSFVIFNTKDEKDAYMAERKMDLLREVKSAISAGRDSGKSSGSFDASI